MPVPLPVNTRRRLHGQKVRQRGRVLLQRVHLRLHTAAHRTQGGTDDDDGEKPDAQAAPDRGILRASNMRRCQSEEDTP
jgi:hypothetical protein